MKFYYNSIKLFMVSLIMMANVSCNNDTDPIAEEVIAPETYLFQRGGESTVSYGGQTTRIEMGGEFVSALKETSETETSLNAKFAHTEGENNFSEATLNASSKSVQSKVAASTDFYASNTTDATAIKADFDSWISAQVNDVFPNWNTDASAGVAGKIQEAGGGSLRYVSAKGIEYNQLINKGLIGALMVDQILNNYLSPAVLDAASNVADFAGIAEEIYNAFKLGRAAIVAKDYSTRNVQAEFLREKISEIVGIRAVYYLQQGKNNLPTDKGGAFHDLSEGIGFIYSLQFTRMPNSTASYFTKSEVDGFMGTLQNGNGFWDLSSETLDEMSATIAAKFKFTLAQAGS
jgi:hypothetical protein